MRAHTHTRATEHISCLTTDKGAGGDGCAIRLKCAVCGWTVCFQYCGLIWALQCWRGCCHTSQSGGNAVWGTIWYI